MPISVGDVSKVLEGWFPPSLAESWDNVGLLLGDPAAPVERVMTCLTLTPESAAEAVRERVSLVVSHHPIFFRPIKRLVSRGPDAPAFELARAGVALFSPHTSFDSAATGVNAQWADLLGLQNVRPLRPANGEPKCKVVVFVPESDLPAVQAAMFAAGAGVIGEYSECSFRIPGVGTFRGSDAANPTVGERGRREEVQELRLEVVVPERKLAEVLAAMRTAHSYEEPAFDVHSLAAEKADVGGGRFGELESATTLSALAKKTQKALNAKLVEWIGDGSRTIRRVAVACGAAAEFMDDARRAGCDVLLTGEARFHDQLKAQSLGIGLVLAGHYASERFAVEALAARLAEQFADLQCWASRDESDGRGFVTADPTAP